MRPLQLMPLVCSLPIVVGCSEPEACADLFGPVTAFVANRSGQALSMLSVTDTILRSGAVLQVAPPSADTLQVDSTRVVPIFPDSSGIVGPFGEEVVVVVAADSRSATAIYRVAFNGCSVQKVAGPDTLMLR